jgi:hypothetical protein
VIPKFKRRRQQKKRQREHKANDVNPTQIGCLNRPVLAFGNDCAHRSTFIATFIASIATFIATLSG